MDDYREEGWGKETQWEDILLSEGKPNIDEHYCPIKKGNSIFEIVEL